MSSNPCSSSGISAGGGPSGSGSSSGAGGGNGPCGACKFLRRKCVPECIFAPYFDSEQGAAHFAAVHKVFGASNISKLLLHIPIHKRLDAVVTICYEAQARLRDPVYGCVAHIFALQQQVVNLQAELTYLQAHLATLELPSPPTPPQQQTLIQPPSLSISDLPTAASTMPATYDLSSLFDPMAQASWPSMQPPRQFDPRLYASVRGLPQSGVHVTDAAGTGASGDLHVLATELLRRHSSLVTSSGLHVPCNDPPPASSISKRELD